MAEKIEFFVDEEQHKIISKFNYDSVYLNKNFSGVYLLKYIVTLDYLFSSTLSRMKVYSLVYSNGEYKIISHDDSSNLKRGRILLTENVMKSVNKNTLENYENLYDGVRLNMYKFQHGFEL